MDQERESALRRGRAAAAEAPQPHVTGQGRSAFQSQDQLPRALSPLRAPREPKPAVRAERPQLWSVLASDEGLARDDLLPDLRTKRWSQGVDLVR